jgi:hypothetical protein
MSGNARFHDKLHRSNHHTLSTAGLLDSAYDPIASPAYPFQGDFILNGNLSASGILYGNFPIVGSIAPDSTDISNAYIAVYNLSSSWESTYTTVSTNSGNWGYQGNDLKALSSNWESTYTTVSTNSGNWNNTYNTVKANSATTWNYQGNDLKALSSNWQSTYTTVNANSSLWGSGGTGGSDVSLLSANWQSTYTTVSSNSSNWNYQGNDLKALSSNWQSTYTTVSSNSGNWNSYTNYIKLKSYSETSQSPSIVSNVATLDLSGGTVFSITLNNSINSFTLQNIPTGVNSFLLSLTQDGTGGKTVTWTFTGKTIKWSGSAPTMTTTANATDIYSFMSIDGNTWYGTAAGQNFV